MKPTYEEVIEAMAEAVHQNGAQSGIPYSKVKVKSGFERQARAALRALQDMMPEPEPRSNFGLSIAEKIDKVLADKGRIYNHFKTMGRNNETK